MCHSSAECMPIDMNERQFWAAFGCEEICEEAHKHSSDKHLSLSHSIWEIHQSLPDLPPGWSQLWLVLHTVNLAVSRILGWIQQLVSRRCWKFAAFHSPQQSFLTPSQDFTQLWDPHKSKNHYYLTKGMEATVGWLRHSHRKQKPPNTEVLWLDGGRPRFGCQLQALDRVPLTPASRVWVWLWMPLYL